MGMTHRFDILLTDLSAGWARVEFVLESQSITLDTGHVGDPLAALAAAGRRVSKGVDAEVRFLCEPDEYHLVVRIRSESALIELSEREAGQGLHAFRLTCEIPAADFSRTVARAFARLEREYGRDCYAEHWSHPFPQVGND